MTFCTNTDRDAAVLVTDLQDANNIFFLFLSLFAWYFLKVHLHHSSNIKRSHKTESRFFCYYFSLMKEGSGSLTNGSGYGWPKKIRIRNTGHHLLKYFIGTLYKSEKQGTFNLYPALGRQNYFPSAIVCQHAEKTLPLQCFIPEKNIYL